MVERTVDHNEGLNVMGITSLDRTVRGRLSEEMTFQQGPETSKWGRHVDMSRQACKVGLIA